MIYNTDHAISRQLKIQFNFQSKTCQFRRLEKSLQKKFVLKAFFILFKFVYEKRNIYEVLFIESNMIC